MRFLHIILTVTFVLLRHVYSWTQLDVSVTPVASLDRFPLLVMCGSEDSLSMRPRTSYGEVAARKFTILLDAYNSAYYTKRPGDRVTKAMPYL